MTTDLWGIFLIKLTSLYLTESIFGGEGRATVKEKCYLEIPSTIIKEFVPQRKICQASFL